MRMEPTWTHAPSIGGRVEHAGGAAQLGAHGAEGRQPVRRQQGARRPEYVRRLLALFPLCAAILKPHLVTEQQTNCIDIPATPCTIFIRFVDDGFSICHSNGFNKNKGTVIARIAIIQIYFSMKIYIYVQFLTEFFALLIICSWCFFQRISLI